MKFQLLFQRASNVIVCKGIEVQLAFPHLIYDEQGGKHLDLWKHFDFIGLVHKIKQSIQILSLDINVIMSKDALSEEDQVQQHENLELGKEKHGGDHCGSGDDYSNTHNSRI